MVELLQGIQPDYADYQRSAEVCLSSILARAYKHLWKDRLGLARVYGVARFHSTEYCTVFGRSCVWQPTSRQPLSLHSALVELPLQHSARVFRALPPETL